jgi:hypothetical protein
MLRASQKQFWVEETGVHRSPSLSEASCALQKSIHSLFMRLIMTVWLVELFNIFVGFLIDRCCP